MFLYARESAKLYFSKIFRCVCVRENVEGKGGRGGGKCLCRPYGLLKKAYFSWPIDFINSSKLKHKMVV